MSETYTTKDGEVITQNSVDDIRNEDGEIDARMLLEGNQDTLISKTDCYNVRKRLLNGERLINLAGEFDVSNRAIHKHATGVCSHTHGIGPLTNTTGNAEGEWVERDT